MEDTMSKVLVCYATGTGCTAGVAARIGETLTRAGMKVDVADFESRPDPAAYAAIVAGSGVRAGSWHPVARKWVARNAAVLKTKPLALFTVGIALAAGPEKRDEMIGHTSRLLAKTGLRPFDTGVFAGWYVPVKFSPIERQIMKITKSPEGDHRDWDAIERWASGIAPALAPASHSSAA